MNDDASTSLSPEEMSRVVALSSTIASAIVMLYFIDRLSGGWFDPLYGWMLFLMETDSLYTGAERYISLGLVGIWGVSWILAGLDSLRFRGSRRLAVAAVTILGFGVILAGMMNWMIRSSGLRGP